LGEGDGSIITNATTWQQANLELSALASLNIVTAQPIALVEEPAAGNATDMQAPEAEVNQRVYVPFGLSRDEIAIIEEATGTI
jgi:hypothetical protein